MSKLNFTTEAEWSTNRDTKGRKKHYDIWIPLSYTFLQSYVKHFPLSFENHYQKCPAAHPKISLWHNISASRTRQECCYNTLYFSGEHQTWNGTSCKSFYVSYILYLTSWQQMYSKTEDVTSVAFLLKIGCSLRAHYPWNLLSLASGSFAMYSSF